jgi:hypothetical protein
MLVFAAVSSMAATYRLKMSATVDVLDESGAVIGRHRLPAKTVITTVDAPSEAASTTPGKRRVGKLKPSKISPAMFKATQPATATLRAEIELKNSYVGTFDGQEAKYWSIGIWAQNEGWDGGEWLTGYAEKSSPVGKRIIDLVKDGKEKKVIIKVAPAKVKNWDDLVYIEDFAEADGSE